MTPSELYTDRINGPVPRTHDTLPEGTATALYSLFRSKADSNWFAQLFPEHCIDGNGVCGTDASALWNNVRGLVPDLLERDSWGLEPTQPDGVIFDLIEYATRRVAKPIEGRWHNYASHYELTFVEAPGRKEFREEVNQLLQRGGTTYELTPSGHIVRIGTPEVQQVIEAMLPASGDAELDRLLNWARSLYTSRKADDRALGIEKLWDSFERLKTVDVHGNKKQSITALLSHITSDEFRAITNQEMTSLTAVGNQFMIRHSETDKHPVPEDARDYLFARMGSLIVYLLRVSNRLA